VQWQPCGRVQAHARHAFGTVGGLLAAHVLPASIRDMVNNVRSYADALASPQCGVARVLTCVAPACRSMFQLSCTSFFSLAGVDVTMEEAACMRDACQLLPLLPAIPAHEQHSAHMIPHTAAITLAMLRAGKRKPRLSPSTSSNIHNSNTPSQGHHTTHLGRLRMRASSSPSFSSALCSR
jgi:hypothetical protein